MSDDVPVLAGIDALPPADKPGRKKPPAAIGYNFASRKFENNTSAHPTDAAVLMALSVEFGKYASAVTFGQDIAGRSERQPKAKIPTLVEAEVRRALEPYARDIRIESIEVDASIRGRVIVAVTYTNLRTKKRHTWAHR